MKLILDILLNL